MKVLVPLPYDVSSLAHGRNLRVVNLLRELNDYCELTCIAATEQLADKARDVLPAVCIDSAAEHAHVPSRFAIRGSALLRRALGFIGMEPQLAADVADRSASADVVLGFDLPSALYLKVAADANGQSLRTVCDLIDDPWLTWKSLPSSRRFSPAGIKTAIAVRVIRRELLPTFDALVTVAPRDAETLSEATGERVAVIPNGITVNKAPLNDRSREPMVVLTGAMDFPPNESAACYMVEHVWPNVLRHLPDSTGGKAANICVSPTGATTKLSPMLAIIGANPTQKVRRLVGATGVRVTGWVEDIDSWLRRAQVAVAPMISGSGMKNKVLEACAAGCPVVATTLGAAGLPTGEENGILVADSPEHMGQQIAELLANHQAARTIGARGREMVRTRFAWFNSSSMLRDILIASERTTKMLRPQPAPAKQNRPLPESVMIQEHCHNREVLIDASS